MDHSVADPLTDLEMYLHDFGKTSTNLIIGITHVDLKPERPISIYRDWLISRQLLYPLSSIDARVRDDVLLLVETMIAKLEAEDAH